MKIFFIGTVSFSQKALEKLLILNARVVGVATKSVSAFNADHADLSPVCETQNIPVKYVLDINAPHIVEWIKSLHPDVIFCFGWSSLLKKEVLTLTDIGVVGFHPSELPMNRGRHPLIWTLALGLERGAASFFFMEEGADDGDILSQETFPVVYEDDASSVYRKIESSALEQLEKILPALEHGTYERRKQDVSKGNIWRKRGIKDGEIDFRMSSYAIYNLVRALTRPYVGAHLLYKGEEIKIWKVKEEIFKETNIEPGKVLFSGNNEIVIKTYNGAVRILEHEFEQLPAQNEYL